MNEQYNGAPLLHSQPGKSRSVFFELFLLSKEKEHLEAEKLIWTRRINRINARLEQIDHKLVALKPGINSQFAGIASVPGEAKQNEFKE